MFQNLNLELIILLQNNLKKVELKARKSKLTLFNAFRN